MSLEDIIKVAKFEGINPQIATTWIAPKNKVRAVQLDTQWHGVEALAGNIDFNSLSEAYLYFMANKDFTERLDQRTAQTTKIAYLFDEHGMLVRTFGGL